MAIVSGLIVSVDAFFIGISLGLQKQCRYRYLLIINAVLLVLCLAGYLVAERIYYRIPFEPDWIVGVSFLALGTGNIVQCLRKRKRRKECAALLSDAAPASKKTIVLSGVVMSVEAMLITMGITFLFLPRATLWIPLTVAFAHLGYSTLSFWGVRGRHAQKIPATISQILSGCALLAYGAMALL